MEFHTGRATKICQDEVGFRAKIEAAIRRYGLVMPLENSYDEINFEDEYMSMNGFAYFDENLWKIQDTKHEEYAVFATRVNRDAFDYVLHYYNGGASFEEVLEEAIEEAKKI